jgi:hypothetical protein
MGHGGQQGHITAIHPSSTSIALIAFGNALSLQALPQALTRIVLNLYGGEQGQPAFWMIADWRAESDGFSAGPVEPSRRGERACDAGAGFGLGRSLGTPSVRIVGE